MQEHEARRTIGPALEPGEQVQWCGAPVAGRIAPRRVGGLLLSLGVSAAVVYRLLPTSHGSTGAALGTLVHSLVEAASGDARLLLPTGVFAVVLVGLVARLMLDRRRLSHTAYAITDRRLLAVVGPRGKVTWSIGPEQVAYVKVRNLGGGMADVRFNHYRQGRGSRNTNRLYTFERMEDPDDDTSFRVLSESSGVRPHEDEKSRHVLGLYGPVGASLVLEVAPAGMWTLEQTRTLGHGLARLLLKVVEGPEELRDGPAPGFTVTVQTRRVQQLRGRRGSVPGWSMDVCIEFIVVEHGERQLRFTLSWMSRFERMRKVLEDVVRSLEPVTSRRA